MTGIASCACAGQLRESASASCASSPRERQIGEAPEISFGSVCADRVDRLVPEFHWRVR